MRGIGRVRLTLAGSYVALMTLLALAAQTSGKGWLFVALLVLTFPVGWVMNLVSFLAVSTVASLLGYDADLSSPLLFTLWVALWAAAAAANALVLMVAVDVSRVVLARSRVRPTS